MKRALPEAARPVQVCWCRLGDSNTRPPHYECGALPAELRRPCALKARENTHARGLLQQRICASLPTDRRFTGNVS